MNKKNTGTDDNPRVSVDGKVDRFVYLDVVKINYEELEKYRLWIHLVQDEEGIGVVCTIASNSMYAGMKAASQGYTVLKTVPILAVLERMAQDDDAYMLDIEEEDN